MADGKLDENTTTELQFGFRPLLVFIAICAVLVLLLKPTGVFDLVTIDSLTDAVSLLAFGGTIALAALAITLKVNEFMPK
jgi:hypothetical protein